MQKFTLSKFETITGIGSSSGIIYHNQVLFIISDNSTFLYQYDLGSKMLLKFPLVQNAQENIPKKEKLDLEAMTSHGNQIFIFGSGSTEKRNVMFSLNLENDKLQKNDTTVLYNHLKDIAELAEDELNIEGAICANKTMLLFQRGNGENNKNGVFIIPDDATKPQHYINIPLPKIGNVPATFTDAILVDDKIYFLAAAEDTTSTYLDGEVLGTIFGVLHAPDFSLISYEIITTKNKFEGLTLYKKDTNQLQFLLCEDADNEVLESDIYLLTINSIRQ
jgi:hypothetical protein